jgi:hypothetical protein
MWIILLLKKCFPPGKRLLSSGGSHVSRPPASACDTCPLAWLNRNNVAGPTWYLIPSRSLMPTLFPYLLSLPRSLSFSTRQPPRRRRTTGYHADDALTATPTFPTIFVPLPRVAARMRAMDAGVVCRQARATAATRGVDGGYNGRRLLQGPAASGPSVGGRCYTGRRRLRQAPAVAAPNVGGNCY